MGMSSHQNKNNGLSQCSPRRPALTNLRGSTPVAIKTPGRMVRLLSPKTHEEAEPKQCVCYCKESPSGTQGCWGSHILLATGTSPWCGDQESLPAPFFPPLMPVGIVSHGLHFGNVSEFLPHLSHHMPTVLNETFGTSAWLANLPCNQLLHLTCPLH